MIRIDGSQGEGGGQILRTALGLSLVTGEPVQLEKIRARRKNPGLARQHLTAVRAAAQVGGARVKGAELKSQKLVFRPGEVRSGDFHFEIGTAGSSTLVLQTVLPPLLSAPGASNVIIEGGTHNPLAPPCEFLQHAFLPLLSRMGPQVHLQLVRHGFYPKGGGRIEVTIQPPDRWQPLDLLERGAITSRRATAVLARLPRHIAHRELDVVCGLLDFTEDETEIAESTTSAGPGNALLLEFRAEHVTEVVSAIGEKGLPAEVVAERAVREARAWLDCEVPVGEHLADQLLIPLALAGGGRFLTLTPSEHTRTNIAVIERFLDGSFEIEEKGNGQWLVRFASR